MHSPFGKLISLLFALIAVAPIGRAQQTTCKQPPPQPFVTQCNPFGSAKTQTVADMECPIGGDSKAGTPTGLQDLVKNNFCSTGSPAAIDITQLATLQTVTTKTLKITQGTPPASRNQLKTAKQLAFHEGDLVRLKAYVLSAETADINLEEKESGESVNCNIGPGNGCSVDFSTPRNDIHIALVAAPKQATCMSVTAEVTPHLRPAAWTATAINGLQNKIVRITGQLMYDGSHSVCSGGKTVDGSPARQSLWEIHPVYSIEVCATAGDAACTSDKWVAFGQTQ